METLLGKNMDLTKKEVEILQEMMILIYKLINQDKTFKSLYFKDTDIEKQYKTESHLINQLNKFEDPENLLRSCIMELEEVKEDKDVGSKSFYEIMSKYRMRDLKGKFNVKNMEDIDKFEGVLKNIKII